MSSLALSIEDYADLAEDYEGYAAATLRIRPKEGADIPFIFNRAQRWLDTCASRALNATGRVRIVGLKGRQQGFSTYVEGRAYWKTTHRKGYRTFILTHDDEGTQNLFGFAKLFHEHCHPDLKPATGAANANELKFAHLNSGYKVATAGGRNVGRSQTIQFFHGSEVAFWPNAESHARGALQAVGDVFDSEIFLESTSDGPGNYFHRMCIGAMAGTNGFTLVFVPWYWQEEYVKPADGLALTKEERDLLEAYGGVQADGGPGMTAEHIAWRRWKVSELGGEEAFKREYPNSVEEAFEVPGYDRLIDPLKLKAAIRREVEPTLVRPIWGLDAGRFGDDSNALAKRQGNVLLEKVKRWGKADTMTTAGRVVAEYRSTPKKDRPSDIIVDAIGIGAGVADRLREVFKDEGWDEHTKVRDVNVGEGAAESEQYNRLRDELWWKGKEWCEDASTRFPADDPDTEIELVTPRFWYTSAGKVQVEGKDEMKKPSRLGRSPDGADALLNTFYVRPKPRKEPRAEEETGSAGGFWAS